MRPRAHLLEFLTTSDYAPRLRARIDVEQQLIDDAAARSWPREIERHAATKRRLEQLIHDLAYAYLVSVCPRFPEPVRVQDTPRSVHRSVTSAV